MKPSMNNNNLSAKSKISGPGLIVVKYNMNNMRRQKQRKYLKQYG